MPTASHRVDRRHAGAELLAGVSGHLGVEAARGLGPRKCSGKSGARPRYSATSSRQPGEVRARCRDPAARQPVDPGDHVEFDFVVNVAKDDLDTVVAEKIDRTVAAFGDSGRHGQRTGRPGAAPPGKSAGVRRSKCRPPTAGRS